MEVHTPKPIRNWREFLKEYAIIVIGVLTALAAEQTAEWLHWRQQVEDARTVIASETAFNLEGAISRMRTLSCIEQRLDALAIILDEAARTGNLPPVGTVGQAPRHQWHSGAWESVVASQTAAHFPPQQLAGLGTLYKNVDRLNEYAVPDTLGWADLYAMVGPGRKLDAASEAALRTAISRQRNTSRIMATVSTSLVAQARAMNLPFTKADLDLITAAEKRPVDSAMQTLFAGALPASTVPICVPIGSVPPHYGEAPVQEAPAAISAAVKTLPDFGARKP
jgi:hypothetical protein